MDGGESQMLPTIQTSLKEKGFGSLEMRIERRMVQLLSNVTTTKHSFKENSGDVDGLWGRVK